jgi:predicted ArsR family transcriptional regulator
MTTQLSIFDRYPHSPGYKEADTSRRAAIAVKPRAATLRQRALELLQQGDYTADEIAGLMGESVLSIRPRIAELNKQGLIVDTAKRRKNASGESAKVWRAK